MYKKTLDLLDTMYDTEPKTTIKMINKPVSVWGLYSSPLTFAYESFMYEFIAKPAGQKWLNRIWHNKLPPDLIPRLKVYVRKKNQIVSQITTSIKKRIKLQLIFFYHPIMDRYMI